MTRVAGPHTASSRQLRAQISSLEQTLIIRTSEAGMRSTVVAVFAVASSLAVAACSNDRDSGALRVVAPNAPSADVIASTCDITTITQLGKAYLTASKDPAFNLITK